MEDQPDKIPENQALKLAMAEKYNTKSPAEISPSKRTDQIGIGGSIAKQCNGKIHKRYQKLLFSKSSKRFLYVHEVDLDASVSHLSIENSRTSLAILKFSESLE